MTKKGLKMTVISTDMLDAIKVQFLKPIFEDDFPERGMTAWLTGVEWIINEGCYKLFFDFKEFEAENEKYFREVYFKNIHTKNCVEKEYYTAIEAGMYTSKYSVYFSIPGDVADEDKFKVEIAKYLKIID